MVIYANSETGNCSGALDIAKEYDLKLIIAGGREAGKVSLAFESSKRVGFAFAWIGR